LEEKLNALKEIDECFIARGNIPHRLSQVLRKYIPMDMGVDLP